MSKPKSKKPAKPSLFHLLTQLGHLRAELDAVIREVEQQTGYSVKHDDADWKWRCKIVEPPDGGWDVMSPCGGYWWEPYFCLWARRANGSGAFATFNHARDALAACTVPPPGERGR